MRKIKNYVVSILVIIITFCTSNSYAEKNSDKIHFLETEGYGDTIILQSNGKFALVDCGEDIESNAILINNYLRSLGATKIDYFIMSHAHSDHIGGFEKLSELIKINKFIGMDLGIDKNSVLRNKSGEPIKMLHPFYDKKNNTWRVPEKEVYSWDTDIYYQKLIKSLSKQGIEKSDKSKFIIPKENETIKIGNYTLKFNNTFSKLEDISEIKEDFNSSSTWITIYKDDIKIVLSGDITSTRGDYIVDKYNIKDVDLYKIAHHCHTGNTSENMIKKMNPKISVAMGVSDLSPTATLLSLYGSKVYFTKDNSNIISATVYSNKILLDKEYKTHSTYLDNIWLKYNGKYYYYKSNSPVKNTWHKSGENKWYWLKSEGEMASNEWVKIDGKWYRFNANGEMLDNTWYKENNKWYWLKSGGKMASNEWVKIDGKWYRFNANGEMLDNTWYKNNKWYRLKSGGGMAFNEWLSIDKEWYRFNANGEMLEGSWYKDSGSKWYWLKSEGEMASNEWVLVDGKWYRFNTNGEMLKNTWYKDIDNNWYWLKSSGEMASSENININGVYYEFSANGCMIR